MLERHHPDPADRLGAWARGFIRSNPTDTLALLADLNNGVTAWISYQSRETEGTQTPVETLDRGWGSCRDLAVLLIEAARSLGFGARIVTGYLYNPATDADEPGSGRVSGVGTIELSRGRSFHSPAPRPTVRPRGQQAPARPTPGPTSDLPGAGWIAYDPTNRTIGGGDLIRVAVTRDISQAVPIAGSFVGATNDYLGMTVDVSVISETRGPARTASRS